MKRVLVVNMNYLGDALMTTPTLALLCQEYGQPVDVIAGGASGYAALDVLRGNPNIGQLIERVDGGASARCLQLFKLIRKGRYDVVVILPSIPAYRWTAILAGAHKIVFVDQTPESAHMAQHILSSVAAKLGISARSPKMTLVVQPSARNAAIRLLDNLSKGKRVIGVNVGASRPQKRWPVQLFQELVRLLQARNDQVILLGSDADSQIASLIVSGLDGDSAAEICDLTGRTSIAELTALIEQCAAVVTADTGAMHIAAALEVPVVALFGSTDPDLTAPIGGGASRVIYKHLDCAPCKSHPTCGGKFTCMSAISALEVAGAVRELTSGHNIAVRQVVATK